MSISVVVTWREAPVGSCANDCLNSRRGISSTGATPAPATAHPRRPIRAPLRLRRRRRRHRTRARRRGTRRRSCPSTATTWGLGGIGRSRKICRDALTTFFRLSTTQGTTELALAAYSLNRKRRPCPSSSTHPRVFPSCRPGRTARPILTLALAATAITATLFGCTGKIGGTAGTRGTAGSTVLPPGVAGPINPGASSRTGSTTSSTTTPCAIWSASTSSRRPTYGFPDDAYVEGFDNNADALTAPPLLLEKLETATEAIVGRGAVDRRRQRGGAGPDHGLRSRQGRRSRLRDADPVDVRVARVPPPRRRRRDVGVRAARGRREVGRRRVRARDRGGPAGDPAVAAFSLPGRGEPGRRAQRAARRLRGRVAAVVLPVEQHARRPALRARRGRRAARRRVDRRRGPAHARRPEVVRAGRQPGGRVAGQPRSWRSSR